MNLFESVKAAVTLRQAAEHYGLKVSRNNMVCCPFHDDRNPSMKLNENYFYCFGCRAKGDVIDFVERFFNLNSYEAAKKLAVDFGISAEPGQSVATPHKPKSCIRQLREDEIQCFRVLTDYLHLLKDWKVRYAPKTPDEKPDNRFVEALQMFCHIEQLVDTLTVGNPEERVTVVDDLMKNGKFELLRDYVAQNKKEEVRHVRREDESLAL